MQLPVLCSNCPNQSLQHQSTSGITFTPCVIQDDDPYVRKTAAVCVAKLHDINAELVEDRGFLDTLKVSIFKTLCSHADAASMELLRHSS